MASVVPLLGALGCCLLVVSFMIDCFGVTEMSNHLLFCIPGPVPDNQCMLYCPSPSHRSVSTLSSLLDVRDVCFSQEKIGAKLEKLSVANQKS